MEATAAEHQEQQEQEEQSDEEVAQPEAPDEGGTEKEDVPTDEEGDVQKDPTDAGVPMLPGSPDEPQGPEDVGGEGPKRGDYERRIVPSLDSHEAVRTDGGSGAAGEPVHTEKGGFDRKPHTRLESQAERALDRGDAEGEKGGVDTDPRSS